MAATESNNDEGSDIFWPGYVDAVTNLVLNLLFILTIMIVAVLMFAMALSRRHEAEVEALKASPKQVPSQLMQENEMKIAALEMQIKQLKAAALVSNSQHTPQKIAIAKTPLPQPDKGLDRLLEHGGGIVVHFVADAVTINASEIEQIEALLKPIAAHGRATIVVEVPTGFSEAKRLGFYRVMAVRNLLIQLGAPAEKLETRVKESGAAADNSKVIVLDGSPS